MSLQPAGWRTSTRSLKTDCVEVGRTANGGAAVRDSKNRTHGYFRASRTQWQLFIAAVKDGTFDL